MAKKREYASDTDVTRFITRKQNPDEELDRPARIQFTVYPTPDDIEQVKILAKLKDVNVNTMFLKLVREALTNEDYQKMIEAYKNLLKF